MELENYDISRRFEEIINKLNHFENILIGSVPTPLTRFEASPHFRRNILPNDDGALQKALMYLWENQVIYPLDSKDLQQSGFRVFSQNDEDGIILRIFAHIGTTNRHVIEIGNNCADSTINIPQNSATNLIVNHGWHGILFEIDPEECSKLRFFFARNYSTAHFHYDVGTQNKYFSPLIVEREVTPKNINEILEEQMVVAEPDLFVLDIDGEDFAVAQALKTIRPRVIMVEFEKRFNSSHSVYQPLRADLNRGCFMQSGIASLAAWEKLLGRTGYVLCSIGLSGFNAFFVRGDVAEGKLTPINAQSAIDQHPIFSSVPEDFWMSPDQTWEVFD